MKPLLLLENSTLMLVFAALIKCHAATIWSLCLGVYIHTDFDSHFLMNLKLLILTILC